MTDDWLEWYVESEFVVDIEEAGWLCLKGDKVRKGFADQFCFGPGPRTVIIEFKAMGAPKKRRGQKLQDYYRGRFRGMGYETYKITGEAEADALRDELLAVPSCDFCGHRPCRCVNKLESVSG